MSNKCKHYKTKWHSMLSNVIQDNEGLDTDALRAKCEELKSPRYKHKVITIGSSAHH
jgi:hypothetical protein